MSNEFEPLNRGWVRHQVAAMLTSYGMNPDDEDLQRVAKNHVIRSFLALMEEAQRKATQKPQDAPNS